MIVFKKISWRHFLSTGDVPTTVFFDKSPTTLIIGENGAGKCFCKNTPIRLKNTKTGEIVETTIGEFYARNV